ncbi:hypothetical protein ACH5RR_041817 [Cinchona calisaya]|uniref:Uncharacterized protein n=1 Tax=Cinchona calisaya TaxID=153742 RepID=A0ABD2XXS8_9GENT
MCRGFNPKEELQCLKIKSFYINLSFSTTSIFQKSLPDSLTLHFLPRINDGPLGINGLNIRPDTLSFITLHRVVSADTTRGTAIYGSRERLRVSEGSRFEVYASDGKVLKGIFRKDEGENWKMDCMSSQLEGDYGGGLIHFLREADVCVEVDGHVAVMRENVRKKKGRCLEGWLEEIPEEREFESDGGCCCCCDCDEKVGGMMDGGDCEMDAAVRWAVDVGIWVMCLGVGYLVSKASCMKFSRQRRLF